MTSQKQSGKGFEYAVVLAICDVLGKSNVSVVDDSNMKIAAKDFINLSQDRQSGDVTAAKPAIELIMKFEPNLVLTKSGKKKLLVSLQSDQAGGLGDVRDILISKGDQSWEIGISAKHYHEALKHSRLSKTIDFGAKWLDMPCSKNYFDSISKIFDYLKGLKAANAVWSEVPNKDTEIYKKLLQAFLDELFRLDKASPGAVAPRLLSYLIGTKDFYKLTKLKKQTKVQVFNFNGTLGSPVGDCFPQTKPAKLKLPSRIVEIAFQRVGSDFSTTTLEMICDAGWQISFRLHSASTKVEPSLKFDIKLIGHPNNLQTSSELW